MCRIANRIRFLMTSRNHHKKMASNWSTKLLKKSLDFYSVWSDFIKKWNEWHALLAYINDNLVQSGISKFGTDGEIWVGQILTQQHIGRFPDSNIKYHQYIKWVLESARLSATVLAPIKTTCFMYFSIKIPKYVLLSRKIHVHSTRERWLKSVT